MIRTSIESVDVIHFLNSILSIDPDAVSELFLRKRVECNESLAAHPTVQVGYIDQQDVSKGFEVGILGILNGMFGSDNDGWGVLALELDATNRNRIHRFVLLVENTKGQSKREVY